MKLIPTIAAVLALACAGCAAKKQITLPMRQAPKARISGAIRTLIFSKVAEQRSEPGNGFRADKGPNETLVKAMMSAEFSSSSYALLNDEILDMVKKSGSVPRYLSDGPTVAADFISQMVGDPGSIGVVEIEVSTAFGQRFTAETRDITLTSTTWTNGVPRATVNTVRVPVHRIDVTGTVTAKIVIRSPYPDGEEVFNKSYTVPAFNYSSVEAAPKNLWLFGRNDAAKQGSAAPTVTEVKAIQFKTLARMFFEDISSSVTEQAATLDSRGDKLSYNLLAEGAIPWAERRLMKIQREGDKTQQAANLYNLGLCWEAQGMAAEAVTKYKAALDIEPGNSLFRRAHDRANSQSR